MAKHRNARAQKAYVRQLRAGTPVRTKNSVERRESGMGTEYDFGTNNFPSPHRLPPYQQDRIAVEMFEGDWQARKIVNIPVDDMLRNGWEYDGNVTEEQKDALLSSDDRYGIQESVRQCMRLERMIGGAALFLGVSDADDPSLPLLLDNIKQGDLKFVNPIPRTRIQKVEWANDPLQADYGRPLHYFINGQKIHRSRLILFRGDPILPTADPTLSVSSWVYGRNDGFGQSKLVALYDDLTRATGSRQAAYQLVQRASVIIAQLDTLELEGTEGGDQRMREMQNIVNQINLFRGAVINRDPGQAGDTITTMSPSFGSVPELVMSFLQVLSAASDIPAMRFLSQAPGGLNTSGDGELEAYYGRLESEQRLTLRPQLMQYLNVMGRSTLGPSFTTLKMDVIFDPLWSLSEVEQADVRTKDTTNVVTLIGAGLITDEEALAELQEREVLKTHIKKRDGLEFSDGEEFTEDQPRPLDDVLAELANPN